MYEPVLKIKLHYPEMAVPSRAHPTDSGLDLSLMKVIEKRPGLYFFDTGISIEPPEGYYAELVPRSSIYQTDFIMTNSVGIIDTDYRGPLYLPMRYLGQGDGLSEARALIGRRIGQLLLKKREPFVTQVVPELSVTARGEGGFGSSGT
jgi:dUTP pyrophosphatase